MKIIKILIFSLLLMFATTGCSMKQAEHAMDAVQINAEYNAVSTGYSVVNRMTVKKWDMFEEADQLTLKEIDANVLLIKKKVNQLRSRDFYKVSPSEIGYIHTLARDSYKSSKNLYVKYKGKLTSSEIIILEMYNEKLVDLDKMVTEFIEDPENGDMNSVLVKILNVTGTGLKLLLPLLVI